MIGEKVKEIKKYSFEQEVHGTTVRVELPETKIREISESEGKNFDQFLKDTNAKVVGTIYPDPFPKEAEPFTAHLLDVNTKNTAFSYYHSRFDKNAKRDYAYHMKLIPQGEFEAVRSPNQSNCERDNPHQFLDTMPKEGSLKVKITRPFWIGTHMVSGNLISHYVRKPSVRKPSRDWSFDTADRYEHLCNELSEAIGLEPCYFNNEVDITKNGFRLPSEAEWYYVAKANEDFIYSGSDNINPVAHWRGNHTLRWYNYNQVGKLKPNAWGMYDMSGNGNELVHNSFGTLKGRYSSDKEIPMGDLDGEGYLVDPIADTRTNYLVAKGGSHEAYENEWSATTCRIDFRNQYAHHPMFRLVRNAL